MKVREMHRQERMATDSSYLIHMSLVVIIREVVTVEKKLKLEVYIVKSNKQLETNKI